MGNIYHPVINYAETPPVLDLTQGLPIEDVLEGDWAIGRYNEKRPGIYTGFHTTDSSSPRDVHMGIDLFAPVGTPVHAAHDGEVVFTNNNDLPGDYGYVTILRHPLEQGRDIYALYGHLGSSVMTLAEVGQQVVSGDVIGHVGTYEENGNWPPHVHFQLAWTRPEVCDMPGVVSGEQLEAALREHPDPRMMLGDIY